MEWARIIGWQQWFGKTDTEVDRIQRQNLKDIGQLAKQHRSMEISAVIDTLEELRGAGKLDIMVDGGIPFYQIAHHIFARSPLPGKDTTRLVEMLFWKELRTYPCRAATISIVRAIHQNPWAEHMPPLSSHLSWIRAETERTKIHDYWRALRSEARILEDLIALSPNWGAPKYGDSVDRSYD